jgi:predicted transcriptional regulator
MMANPLPVLPDTLNQSQDDETIRFVAAVEVGIKAANAGRTVPYEQVRRWLLSWGTEKELPPPALD